MSCYGEIAVLLSSEADKQFNKFISTNTKEDIRQLLKYDVYINEDKETGSKLYKWSFINHHIIDDITNFLKTLDTDLYYYIYVIDEYNEVEENGSYSNDVLVVYPVTYIHIEGEE